MGKKNKGGGGGGVDNKPKEGGKKGGDKKAEKKPDERKNDKDQGGKGKGKAKGKDVPLTKKEKQALKEAKLKEKQNANEALMNKLKISESDYSGGSDSGEHSPMYDKFGNTLSKADASAARKEAKAEKDGRGKGPVTTSGVKGLGGGEVVDYLQEENEKALKLIAQEEAGKKLTNKQKKVVEAYRERIARDEVQVHETMEDPGLAMFSLTMEGAEGGVGEDDDENATVSATDIIVRNFSIAAPKRDLFVNATLRLASGRRYGLLGPNGRGKSTLLRFLAARKLPVPPSIDVLLVEQEVAASDMSVVEQVVAADTQRTALLEEEARLFQEMESEEISSKWTDEEWDAKNKRMSEVCDQLAAISADSAEGRARKILIGLGFSEEMMAGGSTILSGGWRMRVSLARALFMEPRLLLLDEPTNHLDLNAVLWLDDHLANHWKTTILCVSHDQDFLDSICTDILHLDDCQLVQYGNGIDRFRAMVAQNEAKQLKDWKQQEKELKAAKGKGNKNAKQVEEEYLRRKNITKLLERPSTYNVNFTLLSPEDKRPSISVLDASFTWPGAKEPLLKNLHFSVGCTTRVAIVGPNGAGKSTLLNLVTGKLEPTTGEVNRDRFLHMGRYDQHFEELLPLGLSGVDFLRKEYDVKEQEARATLGRFGLDGARHLIPIRELSGGQKARVVFASLSLQAPHILLLDEPTNHLDMESVDALIEAINNFEGGVVLISHDARLISQTNCELWVVPGDQTLVQHKKGFEDYRMRLMKEIQDKEAEEEMVAKEKAEQKTLERAQRMAKHSARGAARDQKAAEVAQALEDAKKQGKELTQEEKALEEKKQQEAEEEQKAAEAAEADQQAKLSALFGKKKKKGKK